MSAAAHKQPHGCALYYDPAAHGYGIQCSTPHPFYACSICERKVCDAHMVYMRMPRVCHVCDDSARASAGAKRVRSSSPDTDHVGGECMRAPFCRTCTKKKEADETDRIALKKIEESCVTYYDQKGGFHTLLGAQSKWTHCYTNRARGESPVLLAVGDVVKLIHNASEMYARIAQFRADELGSMSVEWILSRADLLEAIEFVVDSEEKALTRLADAQVGKDDFTLTDVGTHDVSLTSVVNKVDGMQIQFVWKKDTKNGGKRRITRKT